METTSVLFFFKLDILKESSLKRTGRKKILIKLYNTKNPT